MEKIAKNKYVPQFFIIFMKLRHIFALPLFLYFQHASKKIAVLYRQYNCKPCQYLQTELSF